MEHLFARTEGTDAFWRTFSAASNIDGTYDVVVFGSDAAMANELCDLVLQGPKRATAGLLRDFGPDGEPMPRIGGHVVLVDGQGTPRAIWRTTDVRVGPLSSVDERFAWDEGEGDRTRDDWLRMHHVFFTNQAKRQGFRMHDDIETVFERFAIVWPPEHAD